MSFAISPRLRGTARPAPRPRPAPAAPGGGRRPLRAVLPVMAVGGLEFRRAAQPFGRRGERLDQLQHPPPRRHRLAGVEVGHEPPRPWRAADQRFSAIFHDGCTGSASPASWRSPAPPPARGRPPPRRRSPPRWPAGRGPAAPACRALGAGAAPTTTFVAAGMSRPRRPNCSAPASSSTSLQRRWHALRGSSRRASGGSTRSPCPRPRGRARSRRVRRARAGGIAARCTRPAALGPADLHVHVQPEDELARRDGAVLLAGERV